VREVGGGQVDTDVERRDPDAAPVVDAYRCRVKRVLAAVGRREDLERLPDREPVASDLAMATIEGQATVLLVDDVARALEYYRDALGFEVERYGRLPEHYGYARRDAGSVHFAHWDGVSPRPNREAVPPDMFDAYFYVDDVEGLHGELVERGAEILHGPVEQGYGMREFRIRDPDGYILAFGRRI
jgi:catechol 2,3-dioxygenase-like lactoylglutathione lyase family enzyme